MQPTAVVSGFGPYEEVTDNPSRAIAKALEAAPPEGMRVVAGELPVSFARAGDAYDELLRSCDAQPAALVCIGLKKRGDGFELESRARPTLDPERVDNDGAVGAGTDLGDQREFATSLNLEKLVGVLRNAGAPVVGISDDAGGYVCERVYHHALRRAEERDIPALFLHVPPVEVLPTEQQIPIVRALVAACVDASNRV